MREDVPFECAKLCPVNMGMHAKLALIMARAGPSPMTLTDVDQCFKGKDACRQLCKQDTCTC